MKRSITIVALSLALLLSVGCFKGLDWKSGGDESRAKAKKLKLNEPVNDSLNAFKGDHNDWRIFSLKKKGAVKVIIAFDNWKSINPKVYLRNAFGAVLASYKFDGSQQAKEFGPFILDKGEYFIQVSTVFGESVYTLHVIFKPYKSGDTIKVPRPE
ncbi:MAG: hypothetical protein KC609_24340 [Myxococcales bacterium]|nr:hypothetical protein [Myxococcales bacterium]